jgi:hypothetical protein
MFLCTRSRTLARCANAMFETIPRQENGAIIRVGQVMPVVQLKVSAPLSRANGSPIHRSEGAGDRRLTQSNLKVDSRFASCLPEQVCAGDLLAVCFPSRCAR